VKSDAKGDDATSSSAASKDRTKLTLKLPPRPADYDYYWYQDDDGTWRNEYDDQVRRIACNEWPGATSTNLLFTIL